VQVSIDQDKQPQNEDFGDAEWESCNEDENDDDDGYNYELRDDKRFKQKKAEQSAEAATVKDVFLTARDPFYFKEVVKYYQNNDKGECDVVQPSLEDFEYDVITEHSNIFPLGYPTEQYLSWVKNDVHKALAEVKAQKKKTILAMKRDLFNNSEGQKPAPTVNADRERGLIEENGRFVTHYFKMYRTHGDLCVQTSASMHDATYNSLRGLFKDNNALQIRPSFDNPSRKGHVDKNQDLGSPLKRFSAFGFNPTLERRLNYVYTCCRLKDEKSETQMWINVNYLIQDPVFETAYRADVQRIESHAKMAIKPNEEFTRDEDFNNVSTTFRDAVQIMLQKKYESFFTIKLQGDAESAVERDEETFKQEKDRRKMTRKSEQLTSKGLFENFDSKDFLKVIRGPFYKL
jgi:hypothetical protein